MRRPFRRSLLVMAMMPGDVVPRLLSVADAARYLGVAEGTVRALVARGELQPVRPPSVRRAGESGRRVLLDRVDLDAVVDQWKATSTSAPNEQLSQAALRGWRQSPVRTRKGAA